MGDKKTKRPARSRSGPAGERAEDALHRSNAVLRTLYASTPVLIGVKDRDNRLVSVNQAALDVIGKPESDVLGRNDINLLGGELSPLAIAEDRRVMDSGEMLSTEERALGRIWDVTKSPWRDAADQVLGVVVVAHDVSDRKRVQDRLRASEMQLREHAQSLELRVRERSAELVAERNFIETILDTAPALVMVLDRDGHILRFNKACEEVSGRAREEVLGRRFELLLPANEPDGAHEAIEALRAGRLPDRFENTWLRPDGAQRLIAWTNTFLCDEHGNAQHIVSMGIDVTAQRTAEIESRERLRELAQLHRLHAVGEIAALIAHQLNQPLAAIGAYAEAGRGALRAETFDRATLAGNLERIMEQAQRAGRAIRELRAYLTRGHGVKERANLSDIARAACRLMESEARARRVRIAIEQSEPLPQVEVEVLHVEQVLANLLQNAIEAMRDAGMGSGTIDVRLARDGGEAVRVTVTDSGPGFDADLAQRLFEPLYTTKRDGIGMGLSISRSIVEAHGGRLWAIPGRGGTLHFTLPLAQ